MSDATHLLPVAAVFLALLLVVGRQYLTHRVAMPWWLNAGLDQAAVAATTGVLLAWSAPTWVADPARDAVPLAFLFLAGWVGLQIGCGLDLRALRRAAMWPLLYEGGTAAATVVVVFAFAFVAFQPVLGAPELVPGTLLALAGFCVAGPAMPGGGPALSRGASRGGFWHPSAAALLAALLAAVGSALFTWPLLVTAFPGQPGAILVEFAGAPGRLLGMVVVGCVAGLLADLATKDDFAPGGLLPQLAAVVLLAAGVAGALGLETMLAMAVAGFWLVNATLRRLDILHVLQRGAVLPRLLTPFLGGWLVGEGLRGPGLEAGTFGLVLLLVLILRPASRLLGRRIMLPDQQAPRGRRLETSVASLVQVDALGLLLIAALTRQLQPSAGAAAMAAVLLAQWLLGLGATGWDQRDAADPNQSASQEPSRPKAERPG